MKHDKLKSKKEYYFRQYFNQSELIKTRRQIIEELNRTKKEFIENPVYLGAMQYSDMPHSSNVNTDVVLDKIIKRDERIEKIDKEIMYQVNILNQDMYIFGKINEMLQDFNDNQNKVFELTYRDKMRRIEVAYMVGITERGVQYIKSEIFEKANFIQED